MARVWMSGWEWNSAVNDVEMSITGTPTISTTTVRSGTYSGRISSLTSGVAQSFGFLFSSAAANGPYFASVYLNVATLPSAANRVMQFTTSVGGMVAAIDLNADGTLQLRDEDGTIGSPSLALSTGAWYRVDLKVDRTGIAGAQVVEARLTADNATDTPTVFATSSTRNLSAGMAVVSMGGNLGSEAQTQGNWFFDDARLNDNSGTSESSYPPHEKVILLTPNADGTTTNRGTQGTAWDTGPSASGTAWLQVDEIPPDDATSYIALLTASTGATNLINLVNVTPATGIIGASDTVVCTAIMARIAGQSATACSYVQQLLSGTGTTESAVLGLASASWFVHDDTVPRTLKRVDYTDPNTALAWTLSGLDAVQVGVRAPDATPDVFVSTLGLYVGYTPAVTAPAFIPRRNAPILQAVNRASYW